MRGDEGMRGDTSAWSKDAASVLSCIDAPLGVVSQLLAQLEAAFIPVVSLIVRSYIHQVLLRGFQAFLLFFAAF